MDRRIGVLTILIVFVLGMTIFSLFVGREMSMPPEEDMIISSGSGVLPEEEKPVPEPEGSKAVAAIVIDDLGYTRKNLALIGEIGVPVTLAVLPDTPYAAMVCGFAAKNGLEIILHMPMEPHDPSVKLEKSTIKEDMDAGQIARCLDEAMMSVPGAKGLSNHMGSKATESGAVMTVVMEKLSARNMFFLDSLTSPESAGSRLASEGSVPYAVRDIFLDNEMDRDKIIGNIEKMGQIALSRGAVVAIGHDRSMTIALLKEYLPGLKSKGVEFVLLSEVVGRKDTDSGDGSGHLKTEAERTATRGPDIP